MMFRDGLRRIALLLLMMAGWLLCIPARADVQPALQEFTARLPVLRTQVDAVVASAQQAAAMKLAHPTAQLSVPSRDQASFCEEYLSRAGGLALMSGIDAKKNGGLTGGENVVLLSVRSWEQQQDVMRQRVKDYRDNGWTVTVFGSAAGCPENLGANYFIDNGAPSPAASHGRINILANVALAWMWCCEYGATMSRAGKFPVILYSVAMPGAREYNAKYQSTPEGRQTLLPCDKAIPAGELARAYLQRVEQVVKDCASDRVQQQVVAAAAIISQRVNEGKPIRLTGTGHLIKDEMKTDCRTPWKTFLPRGDAEKLFQQQLAPGALVVWMTYAGLDSAYRSYAEHFVKSGADLITCFAPDPERSKDLPKILAHIDQCWVLPDAEIPIPIFPGHMAPVSGVNVGLVLRMLDDEVMKGVVEKK